MNKQEHFLALASVLSDKANEKKITVVENARLESGKTKDFVKALKTLKLEGKTLMVIDEFDDNFLRATSNIPELKVVGSDNVSVYDVLNSANLVLTKAVADDMNAWANGGEDEKEAK